MKTVPLADVLWDAANKHLWFPGERFYGSSEYSCNAVAIVFGGPGSDYNAAPRQVMGFIDSLGCDHNRSSLFDFKYDEQAQGARYMWLLLAMHVADDENIMVEIAQ